MDPEVSVVVRSCRRSVALIDLVQRLRRQQHDSFEIVIIEQSEDSALTKALDDIADPRIRVFARPPLGAPGARNEGVRMSRGQVLIFIDDDDLPVGDGFIAAHVANYSDPNCLGVNGRLTSDPTRPDRLRFPRLVRWASFRHTVFKDPRTFAFGTLRKIGLDFLIGSNSSLRRSAITRAGGWDEGVPMGEEQSFAFRLARTRTPREYLVYDPKPLIHRRVDVPGGLDRRSSSDWDRKDLVGRIIYYHGVVAHYFPWRFRLLYPLFVLRILQQVLVWLWDADNAKRTPGERIKASFRTLAAFPTIAWHLGWRLPPGTIKRVEAL